MPYGFVLNVRCLIPLASYISQIRIKSLSTSCVEKLRFAALELTGGLQESAFGRHNIVGHVHLGQFCIEEWGYNFHTGGLGLAIKSLAQWPHAGIVFVSSSLLANGIYIHNTIFVNEVWVKKMLCSSLTYK